MKKRVVLIIRDGWGYRKSKEDNAIASTILPFDKSLMSDYPNTLLDASGIAVGLPKKYQGNSEVGHMTIGSGRIIKQEMVRINESIEDETFFKNSVFLKAIKNCKKNKSKLHIAGILQNEGVHAHENHLFALLELCKKNKFGNVLIHIFTDGRDAPVHDSIRHLRKLKKKINEIGIGEIVTISGRYYAMDRNNKWDRTKKAYDAIVEAKSEMIFKSDENAIRMNHKRNVSDEFIIPMVKEGYFGFEEKDSFIFYNFRTDRPRQLMKAICEKDFKHWKRKEKKIFCVAMTNYYAKMSASIAFKQNKIDNKLGEIVSKNNLKQLRISETEKYAHVTFFFDGQEESYLGGEDRILIPSPKVKTYDLKPEMSVLDIAKNTVKKIDEGLYDLIVINLVNADMVGHTGNVGAIKKALIAVDSALEKITLSALEKDYAVFVFADHGNAEDQRPTWRTSHTINPVPFILVSDNKNVKLREGGGLSDIAPTVLDVMGLKKPKEMSGKSLIL